jgi:hypothetical protein
MRKKFLPLLIAITMFLVPFGSAFAYTDAKQTTPGFLQGKLPSSSNGVTTSNFASLTDNNINTMGVTFDAREDYIEFTFSTPVTINKTYYKSSVYADFELLNSNRSVLKSVSLGDGARTDGNFLTFADVPDVKYMKVKWAGNGSIYEVDAYGFAPMVKTDVTNVDVNTVTKNNANVVWSNPTGYSGVTYDGAKIYLNGVLKATASPTDTSYSLANLTPNTNNIVKVTASYSDGSQTIGMTKNFKTNEIPNITDLNQSGSHKTVVFSWKNPDDPEYDGVKIYRDGILLEVVAKGISTFTDNSVTPLTTYSYTFISFDSNDFEGSGVSSSITTKPLPPVKTVQDVNVSTTHNRVNLSWNLPDQEGLKHVNIYREKIKKELGFFESIFSLSGTKVYAAGSNKIFETNGTYFNDLTVVPDSEYEYILTTQIDDGRESEGVTIVAETKEEPVPVIKEPGSTVNPSGDYVVTWSEPTKGKVKVLLDGTNYKTVDASLKQLIIPKSDMKYNILGEPKIALIPVGEYGTEGSKTFLNGGVVSSLKLPFDVNDLLKTIMGIIGLFGPFILLTLVIYYFKPIKNLIVRAAHRIRKGEAKHE